MKTTIYDERRMRSFRLLQYLLQVKESLGLTDHEVYTTLNMSSKTFIKLKRLDASHAIKGGG